MDQGTLLEKEDKESCHSCMQHSVLTCPIILPNIIRIYQIVAEVQARYSSDVR